MRESVSTKARRYLTEGRVIVTHARPGHSIHASVRGDGAIYQAAWRHGTWSCNCPVRTDQCAHLLALRLISAPDLGERS